MEFLNGLFISYTAVCFVKLFNEASVIHIDIQKIDKFVDTVAMGNGSSFDQARTVFLDINGKEEKVKC